jgi:hypothetical protein
VAPAKLQQPGSTLHPLSLLQKMRPIPTQTRKQNNCTAIRTKTDSHKNLTNKTLASQRENTEQNKNRTSTRNYTVSIDYWVFVGVMIPARHDTSY